MTVDPTEIAKLQGEIVGSIYERERLERAMDEAMAAIRNTDYGKAHRLLYEARKPEVS